MTPTPPYKVADEPTLKPCPFCGGDARRNQAGEWFGTGCDGSTKCPAFLSGLMYRTQDEADAAWNRRASPALAPTDEAVIRQMVDALEQSRDDVFDVLDAIVDHPALARRRERAKAQLVEHDAALTAGRALLSRSPKVDAWMPIESAPKDGTRILLGRAPTTDEDGEPVDGVSVQGFWMEGYGDQPDDMGHDDGWVDMEFQRFHPGRSFGIEGFQYKADAPTHWKPLPAPPKVDTGTPSGDQNRGAKSDCDA